jgi:hydroxyethylthiazole kinase-like uncharacterized protein yjeF
MQCIRPNRSWPLHDVAASRKLEHQAQAALPNHALMQRAGLACARLARALTPHARSVWIACGPGNNGGDGFEAALHLHRLGWHVSLTWTGAAHQPPDAKISLERARAAGLSLQEKPPANFDLAIDALLGLGGELSTHRAGSAQMLQWLAHMHGSAAPVLAVDLPTGLDGGTGASSAPPPGLAPRHTLSLLSLKSGLFTGQGRDQAGQVWFDDLGVEAFEEAPTALLLGADLAGAPPRRAARHGSHKGSFGDVVVVGGEHSPQGTRMTGAALLAARAALHAGAGRVYLTLLGEAGLNLDLGQPELMFRPLDPLNTLVAGQVVVAGCGGGRSVASALPGLLAQDCGLVLDADGLNAVAADPSLRQLLCRRSPRAGTVLTPHPLEAGRLLNMTVAQVQADRQRAAQSLAEEFGCVVVLKGSGSIVAAPTRTPVINLTGNAQLATAGTGDVLAGMVGAAMAQGLCAHAAALQAVHAHGALADAWLHSEPSKLLVASDLIG